MIFVMHVRFACPRCDQTSCAEVPNGATAVGCRQCHAQLELPSGAFEDGRLARCLVCPGTDLFVRKDFPQGLGAAIVVFGFAASCLTWYYYWIYFTFGILFATALADVVLYVLIGEVVVCYRCGAQYRQLGPAGQHRPFDLVTHERHRQQAARLPRQQAAGRRGAAGN